MKLILGPHSKKKLAVSSLPNSIYISFRVFWKSNQELANPFSRLDLHAIETVGIDMF
jgi:hypothetical protein